MSRAIRSVGLAAVLFVVFLLTAGLRGCGIHEEMSFITERIILSMIFLPDEPPPFPTGAAAGDFDEDGEQDAVVALEEIDKIMIFLGAGNGTGVAYPTGDGPTDVTTGDFNADGNVDVATSNGGLGSGNTVSVLDGAGDGTFAAPRNFTVGLNPFAIARGDLNSDGRLDLVSVNRSSNDISILLNNGMGGFSGPTNLAAGSFPSGVVLADISADSRLDIMVMNAGSGNVSVYLSSGSPGTFAAPVTYAAGVNPMNGVAADFNVDGLVDLAVASNGHDNSVTLLRNLGSGTLGAGTAIPVGSFLWDIAAATDFGPNSAPDLLVTSTGMNALIVLPNNGDGTFGARQMYSTGDYPVDVDVGHAGDDLLEDVLVTNYFGHTVSLHTRRSPAKLDGVQLADLGDAFAYGMLVASFNGDDFLDIATVGVSGPGAGNLDIRLGTIGGDFGPPTLYPTGNDPRALAAGLFNADGFTDLAVVNSGSGNVGIYLGNGDGTFDAPTTFSISPGTGAISVAVGDFNLDGEADLLVANETSGNVSYLRGNGDGSFNAATVHDVGGIDPRPQAIAVSDFNSDNKLDFATANANENSVSIVLGNGLGGFGPPLDYSGCGTCSDLVPGDYDGDGTVDLATVKSQAPEQIRILKGGGNGTFNHNFFQIPIGRGAMRAATGDLDGDGDLDLVVTNKNESTIEVLTGNGDATFTAHGKVHAGFLPGPIGLASWNGDARLDLVFGSQGAYTIGFTENDTNLAAVSSMTPVAGPASGGQTLTITGTNLAGATRVIFGGVEGVITDNTATSITVLTPPHTVGAVTVLADTGGGLATAGTYTYESDPEEPPQPPTGVAATAVTSSSINVMWNGSAHATSYRIERRGAGQMAFTLLGTSGSSPFLDTSVMPDRAYLYRVVAVNSFGSSAPSAADVATAIIFTDPVLTGQVVAAIHFVECQRAANALRLLAGLAAFEFTRSMVPGDVIDADDMYEIRTAIEEAMVALGYSPFAYTDSDLTGVKVKGIHVEQARARGR